MRTGVLIGFLLVCIPTVLFFGSCDKGTVIVSTEGNRPVAPRYACPMHPQYTSAIGGTAPCCGMQMEQVEEKPLLPVLSQGTGQSAGHITVSPETQARMGITVTTASKTSLTRGLHLFGRVTVDETRVYSVLAGIEGIAREVAPLSTGSRTEKDQLLVSMAAPDAWTLIQAFLVSLDTVERRYGAALPNPQQMQAAAAASEQVINKLLNTGMSRLQIEEIRRTRQAPADLRITSPADGIVLARDISTGQRVEKGAEIFRIADVSRIWVVASVSQKLARYIRPGGSAQIKLVDDVTTLCATVSDIPPQFDPVTNALKVRFEVTNDGYVLKPDMFVNVEVPVHLPEAVTVPAEAIIDDGRRKTLYVVTDNGAFAPREIETGWRFDGQAEVLRGLDSGERFVLSGNFLLDSETQMRRAGTGLPAAHEKDPVCSMNVSTSEQRSSYQGGTYSFCSEKCRRQFEADPQRYSGQRSQKARRERKDHSSD